MRLAFIISGTHKSPMGYRARAFAEYLRPHYDIHVAYREGNKVIGLMRFWSFLRAVRPEATYVFDTSYSAVLGSWLYRLLNRNVLIIETGDAIYELMRSTGNRSRLGLWLTRWLENFAFQSADHIVVRGRFYQQWLEKRGVTSTVIQDGVDAARFIGTDANELRREYGVEGSLTVGMVGSSIWSEKLQMCYGWELIELLRLMKDRSVKGIMIGGGSGIAHLKKRCVEYGIADRMVFLGHVPYEDLPRHLNMIDVCLSTQTNDIVGQVRTTGKLPLYLAAGRFILASRVGEASLVLDENMLVEYDDVKDLAYPQKLKDKIEWIITHPEVLNAATENVALAQKYFDYSILSARLAATIDSLLKHKYADETVSVTVS